jgi:hypothetical protein
MKNKLFLLLCLPAMFLVTACGKHDDAPAVVDTGAVTTAANTCQNGSVYNQSYGCLPAQYGQPSGYNGYNGGTGVQVTIPSNHYCSGNGGGFGYQSGNRCWNNGYSYHWQYSAGFYYYW